MNGWIKLHRKLIEKPIWLCSTPEQKVILVTLLMMANHDENEWEWKGEKYHCKPGEFITSLQNIAKECGKGISIQNVRTALVRFKKYEFLTCETTNRNTKVIIENWGKYQDRQSEPNMPTNRQLTGNQQATNKQLTTNKNDKNDKNDKKEDIYTQFVDGFHAICPSFPRVVKITDARKRAIKKTMAEHNLDTIKTVFKKAEASDFLTGKSSDFKASFDWILKPANLVKILEGNYDNRKPKNKEPLGGRVNVSAIEEYERLKNEGQL